MNEVITIEEIEATNAYKNLSDIQKHFIRKRHSRQIITDTLIVISNNGSLNKSIGQANISIVLDLYFLKNGHEYKS